MSIVTETYLYCDGGSEECPLDSAGNVDSAKQNLTATQLRQMQATEGWVYRGRKDYCQACAKRLGYSTET
jgi:hypothetical protein